MTKPKTHPCPKCGRAMHRSGLNASGKPRWACRSGREKGGRRPVCYQTVDPESPGVRTFDKTGGLEAPQVFKRALKPVKVFVFTAAQNNTNVHTQFLESLKQCVKHRDAELVVQPIHYYNPTRRPASGSDDDDTRKWWDPAVVPYLVNTRLAFHKNITFLGDIRIQPTASEPLTGLEGFTGAESTIVGHTKLQFKAVPTPGHKMAKVMTTTGAVTRANYSDSRAGAAGKFHHTLGAVIVEVDGPFFWLRHLNANGRGEFTDLDVRYTPEGAFEAPCPAALVLGDVHVDAIDKTVEAATFGPAGLVETLKPENIVYHDLCDGYAANPHSRKNPFTAVGKIRAAMNDVEAETRRAIKWAKNMTPPWAKGWIVDSNHDRFLSRWLADTDWRDDPSNAEFYLETALAVVRSAIMKPGGVQYVDPFRYWVVRYQIPNVRCVPDDGWRFAGIEMGMHGDEGPNGVRGTIRNIRRIGVKSVIGHSHSPGVNEGAYQTGTSSLLSMEYNKGAPSSWLHTHCVVHRDGKRQLVTVVDGRYRA